MFALDDVRFTTAFRHVLLKACRIFSVNGDVATICRFTAWFINAFIVRAQLFK